MTRKKVNSGKQKISPDFAARLDRLGSQEKVHAIVLLRIRDSNASASKRPSRGEREARMEAIVKSAEKSLSKIDDILARFDGRRLADSPDALGSIPVETTKAGIKALASSRWVKAILEDQEIHLIQ